MDEPFSALDVLTAENLRGELMELWLGKKIPTKSIFLVTHNIEEAVLLADRIIVLGRNPARIRADFRVPLAAAAGTQFRRVSAVRRLHLQAHDAAGARRPRRRRRRTARRRQPYQMLPHARPGRHRRIARAAERSRRQGGSVPHRRGTAHGGGRSACRSSRPRRCSASPNPTRATSRSRRAARRSPKPTLPRESACSAKPRWRTSRCCSRCNSALASKSDHTMPLEFFRDILDEHFSDDEVAAADRDGAELGPLRGHLHLRFRDRPAVAATSRRVAVDSPAGAARTDGRASCKSAPAFRPGEALPPRCSSFVARSADRLRRPGAVLWPALAGALLGGPRQHAGRNSLCIPRRLPMYALFSVARIAVAYLRQPGGHAGLRICRRAQRQGRAHSDSAARHAAVHPGAELSSRR